MQPKLLLHAEESETEIILHGVDIGNIQRIVISVFAETGLCPSKMEIMEPSLEDLQPLPCGLQEQNGRTAGYSPVILASKNVDLLSGGVTVSYFIIPLIISVFMSAALLIMSVVVFNKKQL